MINKNSINKKATYTIFNLEILRQNIKIIIIFLSSYKELNNKIDIKEKINCNFYIKVCFFKNKRKIK